MFIWRGLGLLIVFVALLSYAVGAGVGFLIGERVGWRVHPSTGFGLAIGAGLAWFLLRAFARWRGEHQDSLFFIPARYWAWIALIFGLFIAALTAAGVTPITGPDGALIPA